MRVAELAMEVGEAGRGNFELTHHRPACYPGPANGAYSMTLIRWAAVAAFACALSGPGTAQSSFPERNIRLLFGFSAGVDVQTRLVADRLSEVLGKPVIIENVTGAAGNIAADRTAKASPDGYTIAMLGNANIVINASLYNRLPFDPVRDFAPIIQVYAYPNIVVVNNDVAVSNVGELVELARARPGKLTFGHTGPGSTQHLSGELLKSMARIDVQQVPFRGSPQVATDLIGGQITMGFINPSIGLSLVREGKIRALAVTSLSRAPFAPDLPTMEEAGFPGFDVTAWFGLFAPAGTPRPIIERINTETAKILALPDIRKKFYDLGVVPVSNTPEEFAKVIAVETAYWARIVKDASIAKIE
jgi:tripartite-type tricarboxylate transporter receptor subunit TctC